MSPQVMKLLDDGIAAMDARAAAEVALRKDAERYRWHRARNPGALLAIAWGASSMACAIGDDPDAATDAAMAEFVLPNVGAKRAP